MKPPKCRLCSHEHWNSEPHVFASNAASNKDQSASNRVRVDGAAKETPAIVLDRGIPGSADHRDGVLDEGAGNKVVQLASELRPVKQRWSREAYNAYQRELMRRRRADAKQRAA